MNTDIGKKHEEFSILLTSPERKRLYMTGDAGYESIVGLGIRSKVQIDGKTIAFLYYFDREGSNMSKLRLGITSSVTTLLLISAVVFVLLSLLVAFWLSKRLTHRCSCLFRRLTV
ncbi:hypothetical protein [Bacillus alveayuensis]|uniref:hypothetical protein n=1 Tax=Aeribacillus alveayuensis TaxID=279215 RepID=UPI001F362806|nr:hypothetical protein [Bacillus alveayuensis]